MLVRAVVLAVMIPVVAFVALVLHALRPVCRLWRRGSRPVRSLWSGSPLPTLAVNAKAERSLGVEAETLVYTTYFITDAFDHDLTRLGRVPVVRWMLPFAVFLWASVRFDRFHFFCNRGLLPPARERHVGAWELALYRLLGKDVFFWTYGADVRTRRATEATGRPNCCVECPEPGRFCICDDEAGTANQSRIRRFATAVFSMGDMIHYTPGSINDLFYWPVDLAVEGGRKYAPSIPAGVSNGPLRVVHAPNQRQFKGSRHLIAAVERLEAEGVAIDLVLVEGRPNDEALAIYRSADVVFDQCLIGFHGYFAHEAMALGKPVLCYLRDPEAYLIDADACPIISTPPGRIEEVLRRLACDRSLLRALGERGRAYIERYHTPERFAERLHRTYLALGVVRS